MRGWALRGSSAHIPKVEARVILVPGRDSCAKKRGNPSMATKQSSPGLVLGCGFVGTGALPGFDSLPGVAVPCHVCKLLLSNLFVNTGVA